MYQAIYYLRNHFFSILMVVVPEKSINLENWKQLPVKDIELKL